MSSVVRLGRDETALLLIDVQTRLLPSIHEGERVVRNCQVLLQAARQLKLPVIVTEQNPDRLGPTVAELGEFDPPALAKMTFSSCTSQVAEALHGTGRQTVLLCGMETHVCVLQTALDLIEGGYTVFAALDALSSRTPENARIGWERMRQAGVWATSTESAVFELLGEAGTADFKAMLPYLK